MLSELAGVFLKALLSAFGNALADMFKNWEATTEARARGQADVVAAENKKAAETSDAMDKAGVNRPSDDDVASSLQSRTF